MPTQGIQNEKSSAGEVSISEWDSIADLPLTGKQHNVLGYLINQVSIRRTSELTGVPVEQISNWVNYDPNFSLALNRLQANREAFMRSDLMGLQLKAAEVMAWYLTEDVNALDEDQKPKYSERMQIALLQEKRKVASQIIGHAMSRSTVKQVRVTHTMQEQVDAETVKQLQDMYVEEDSSDGEFRTVHRSEIEDGSLVEPETFRPVEDSNDESINPATD